MTLLDNLILYWKFDESSGDAVDSVSSVTMTNNNTCTYSAGVINNGINMVSAANQFLGHTDSGVFNFNSDFTMSFWAKVTAGTSGAKPIIVHRGATNASSAYFLGYNPTDHNWIMAIYPSGFTGANYYFGLNAVSIGTGTYAYVAITCTLANSNSTKCTLYINGASQGNLSLADGTGTTSINTSGGADFNIGFDTQSSSNWNGSLDEMGIWTRVLSGAEITSLYNGGAGLSYPFGISAVNSNFLAFM